MEECLFCQKLKDKTDKVGETDNFMIIRDGFPVTEGHSLIIPKRHVNKITELTSDEFSELQGIFSFLECKFNVDYNIGINCGKNAGQTIDHLHIHFIPRREGDVENPRGGVRGVIPSKQNY